MKARIYKSTGSWYVAKATDGKLYNARIKGIFKIDEITSTNPLAVGDEVEMVIEDIQEESAMIDHIFDRKNYVARVSPHNKRQHHIIASNLDQSILFATLKEPKTSQGFMDRFLISCESYHIHAIIVFNKADLYKKKEMERFALLKEIYESIGYKAHLTQSQRSTCHLEWHGVFVRLCHVVRAESRASIEPSATQHRCWYRCFSYPCSACVGQMQRQQVWVASGLGR